MQFYQPQQPNITHLVFYFLLNSQVFDDQIKTTPPPPPPPPYWLESSSRQLSHLARALTKFSSDFFTIIKGRRTNPSY